ncbi:MAG TPA: hypothetical protein VHT97_04890 [Acidimicrobiales bacterium]|jgi:hypothetical protein|nr:hypothetical protein [Acidimicrobiales bacterium]
MNWLWIGDAVLLVVVAPLVLLFAGRVLRRIRAIGRLSNDVLTHGLALSANLQAVPKLVETKRLTGAARSLVGRYGAGLVALL